MSNPGLVVAARSPSLDNLFHLRYPQGNWPGPGASLSSAAAAEVSSSASLSTQIRMAAAGTAATAGSGTLTSSSSSPLTAPLVASTDVTYVGSFTLPTSAGGVDWTYGGQGLGIGPTNAGSPTLLFCANGNGSYYGKIGQFTIPAIGGTATYLRSGSCPGNWSSETGNSEAMIGSYYDSGTGNVICSGIGTYSNSSQDIGSMIAGNSTLSSWLTTQVTSGTESARLGAGSMGPIPPEWQSLMGGDTVYSVNGPHSIDSNAENGCGLFTFNPSLLTGSGAIPVNRIIHYPYTTTSDYRCSSTGAGTSLFIETCYVSGAAWVPNTRSIIFFGQRAMGSLSDYYTQNPFAQCYGTATACSDPCQVDNKGFHGYPFRINMWMYDLAAALSAANTWTPLPYVDAGVPGTLGSNDCWDLLSGSSGGCYDPTTSNFYISLGEDTPTIYVFHIAHP